MGHDPIRGAMARPISRRQLLKSSATAAGAAAFVAATGGAALASSRRQATSGGRRFQQEDHAGTMLMGFSGGYSMNAELLALEAWKAATGGDATFNNVPFDEKPLAIAGIIATQDSSWDLMYTYDKFMQQFGARVLLPLADGYTGDIADFSPAILPSFTSQSDQVLRGLPIHFGGYLWGYNKALWEEIGEDPENPPSTWDELFALTPKFTEKGFEASVQPWLGTSGTFGDFYFKQMYNSFGVPFLSADRTQVAFSGPEGLQTFETIDRGLKAGYWAADSLNLANEHDAWVVFDQGKVGGIVEGGDNEHLMPAENYGLKPMPGINAGTTGSVEGSDGLGIPRFGVQQPAAWSYFNTLFSPEIARSIVLDTEEHYPPARLSLLADPEVQATVPRAAVWGEQAKGQVNLWSAPYNYSPVFDEVITKLIKGEYSAQQAHDAAVTGVQDLITQWLVS